MKELLIAFKDEMLPRVRGRWKTQTRRVVKDIDHDLLDMMCEDPKTGKPDSEMLELIYGPSTDDEGNLVPEQWMVRCTECPEEGVLTVGQGYGRVGDVLLVSGTDLKIEITSVRLEKLRDISKADAEAEGVERHQGAWVDYQNRTDHHTAGDPRTSFATLWLSIKGRESWAANPWVWVIEFRRIEE